MHLLSSRLCLIFNRMHFSSHVPKAVAVWKGGLAGSKKKLAAAIADPSESPELFDEGWTDALAREQGESPGIHPSVNGVA